MAVTSEQLQFSYRGKEYHFINETKQNLETFVCPVCFKSTSNQLWPLVLQEMYFKFEDMSSVSNSL